MKTRSAIILSVTVLVVCACAASRKAQSLQENAVAARLQLSSDDEEPMLPALESLRAKSDTIKVTGLNGEEMSS